TLIELKKHPQIPYKLRYGADSMAVDISFGELAFILIGIAATLMGVFITYTLIDAREHRKSRQDFKNVVLSVRKRCS
ncbi:MAG: hypothetical protein WB392_08300, partial [Methanotrichaceae archaeon]